MKANQLVCVLLLLTLVCGCNKKPATSIATNPTATNSFDQFDAATNDVVTEQPINGIIAKAEKGDAFAQFKLGYMYFYGEDGVSKDEVEAVKWWRKAADQNLAIAQLCLGNCYANGDGLAKDAVEGVKWYRKAAEQNFAPAQFNLGNAYREGEGLAKDEVEAVKWYLKAAEQNYVPAQVHLGIYYLNGGVATNFVQAVKWYRKAAEQNDAWAQVGLGSCYALGRGVAKDQVEAAKWVRKAAEQGNAVAQFLLGVVYRAGAGIPRNYVEAVKWYRKAAEQGNADAQIELGKLYSSGLGVAKDEAEAAKWFRKAAEQGDSNAQTLLGWDYETGDGLLKDYVQAYKWYNLASVQGIELAKQSLSHIEAMMTNEQIAEAQRLAREFKPRKAPQTSLYASREGIFDSNPAASGTGFFISEDGFLVTNNHVVRDATQVRLVTSTGLISAKVVKFDSANDLALLKAEGKFSPLPIISSRVVKLGGTVVTVGFPNIGMQGFAPKVAKGEIASLSGASDDARYFQISVPVQPGNSGGALVDERGNVVGIVSAKLNASAALAASGALPENVNYAVKGSFLLSFLESVPEVSAKLKEPNTGERKFEDVVKSAEQAAVLVLVY